MSIKNKLSKISVTNSLPSVFSWGKDETVPTDLMGAEIIQFGAPSDRCDLEGGGLIIDYKPKGSGDIKRLALSFTEEGMWIAYLGIVTI